MVKRGFALVAMMLLATYAVASASTLDLMISNSTVFVTTAPTAASTSIAILGVQPAAENTVSIMGMPTSDGSIWGAKITAVEIVSVQKAEYSGDAGGIYVGLSGANYTTTSAAISEVTLSTTSTYDAVMNTRTNYVGIQLGNT